MIDKKELRALAMKATPGEWKWGACEKMHHVSVYDDEDRLVRDIFCYDSAHFRKTDRGRQDLLNSQFIAAANPTTIISLLDENERLRAALEKVGLELNAFFLESDSLRDHMALNKAWRIIKKALNPGEEE